jgi:ATP-dependent protease Clp ATPase subunit
VPSPKSPQAHLIQHLIGQEADKWRIAVGVSNHFKRTVDSIEPDDPIVTDRELKIVRIEKSNILLS